jgi:hypothetical protein
VIFNNIFNQHNLARSSTDKVGLPIRVCELPWTPRIKGIADRKQTLDDPSNFLKVSGPIICTLNTHCDINK